MFERFTDGARRVVAMAEAQARDLKHDRIGTEHVLLGLLNSEGVARTVIDFFLDLPWAMGQSGGARYDIYGRVEAMHNKVDEVPRAIPFTPRAKKVLELSLREALQLGHNYIGTEHMLLGLVREGEGGAAKILREMVRDDDLSIVRRRVIYTLSGGRWTESSDLQAHPIIQRHPRAAFGYMVEDGKFVVQRTTVDRIAVLDDEDDARLVVEALNRKRES